MNNDEIARSIASTASGSDYINLVVKISAALNNLDVAWSARLNIITSKIGVLSDEATVAMMNDHKLTYKKTPTIKECEQYTFGFRAGFQRCQSLLSKRG